MLLPLLHWNLLMTLWKYLCYTKLMFSVFLWSFFAKVHVPFFSLSFSFHHHLMLSGSESASTFNPLGISLRSCDFGLTFFDFLWSEATRFFLGNFLINWDVLCATQIFIVNYSHILFVYFNWLLWILSLLFVYENYFLSVHKLLS